MARRERSSDTIYRAFGDLLRILRHERRLSQYALAKLVGLNRTSITNMENGRQHVTLDMLLYLAAALNVRPEKMLPRIDGKRAKRGDKT